MAGKPGNSFFWAQAHVEPKRQYKFIVMIPGLPGNGQFYATKASRPGVKIGETPHKYLNHTFYYPGVAEWEPVTISFVDPGGQNDMTRGLYESLLNMGYVIPTNAQLVTERTITKADATSAFNMIQIKTLTSKGGPSSERSPNTETSESWWLQNAWPTDIKWGDLDYSGDGMVSLDVTFRYDWAVNTAGDKTPR